MYDNVCFVTTLISQNDIKPFELNVIKQMHFIIKTLIIWEVFPVYEMWFLSKYAAQMLMGAHLFCVSKSHNGLISTQFPGGVKLEFIVWFEAGNVSYKQSGFIQGIFA